MAENSCQYIFGCGDFGSPSDQSSIRPSPQKHSASIDETAMALLVSYDGKQYGLEIRDDLMVWGGEYGESTRADSRPHLTRHQASSISSFFHPSQEANRPCCKILGLDCS